MVSAAARMAGQAKRRMISNVPEALRAVMATGRAAWMRPATQPGRCSAELRYLLFSNAAVIAGFDPADISPALREDRSKSAAMLRLWPACGGAKLRMGGCHPNDQINPDELHEIGKITQADILASNRL